MGIGDAHDAQDQQGATVRGGTQGGTGAGLHDKRARCAEMTAPVRIQRRRTTGWRMPPNTVYVGRPSRYANPWAIRRTRLQWIVQDTVRNWFPSNDRVARRFAVWRFRRWLLTSAFARRRMRIDELRGKNLACWCPLDRPCHADVLLELANQ
jgi:hypothetical protein